MLRWLADVLVLGRVSGLILQVLLGLNSFPISYDWCSCASFIFVVSSDVCENDRLFWLEKLVYWVGSVGALGWMCVLYDEFLQFLHLICSMFCVSLICLFTADQLVWLVFLIVLTDSIVLWCASSVVVVVKSFRDRRILYTNSIILMIISWILFVGCFTVSTSLISTSFCLSRFHWRLGILLSGTVFLPFLTLLICSSS